MSENFVALIKHAIRALYEDKDGVYAIDFTGGFDNLDQLVFNSVPDGFCWAGYQNAEECFQAWLERVSQ